MFQNFTTQIREIFYGNLLMVICSIFYLIWWGITFRPGAGGTAVGTICIGLAFILGVMGVVLTVKGLNGRQLQAQTQTIPVWGIAAGGAITYVILLAVTSGLLHRQVTSELLIITAWAVLELSLVSFLYGVGRFSMPVTLGSVILILVAATISMVCYLLYYSLAPYPGFIDGMIPLIAVAVVMMSINAALAFSKG